MKSTSSMHQKAINIVNYMTTSIYHRNTTSWSNLSCHAWLGTFAKQILDHSEVTVLWADKQRRCSIDHLTVNVGTIWNQFFYHFHMVALACNEEWSPSVLAHKDNNTRAYHIASATPCKTVIPSTNLVSMEDIMVNMKQRPDLCIFWIWLSLRANH